MRSDDSLDQNTIISNRQITLLTGWSEPADAEQIRHIVDITSEETIYLMLVTRAGDILWRGEGPYAAATAESLVQALAELLGAPVVQKET